LFLQYPKMIISSADTGSTERKAAARVPFTTLQDDYLKALGRIEEKMGGYDINFFLAVRSKMSYRRELITGANLEVPLLRVCPK